MHTPIILTNFKASESAVGKNAVFLAEAHEHIATETGRNFAVAVQTADIFAVSHAVKIPVFAQHCDGISFGSHTGSILPETLKAAGATGVILNHSEHRFPRFDLLKAAANRAKEVGLVVCVCAENVAESEKIARELNPDFVAIEPPELIGGDISVSSAKPDLITEAVQHIGRSRLLVGAGIKNGNDVEKALMLGSVGVLLASGVTKSKNPETVLRDLVSHIS